MLKELKPQSEDERHIASHRVHCFVDLEVASNPIKKKIISVST